ncbi:uncharacterized protein LOC144609290 [Rhinoraja longicauda]
MPYAAPSLAPRRPLLEPHTNEARVRSSPAAYALTPPDLLPVLAVPRSSPSLAESSSPVGWPPKAPSDAKRSWRHLARDSRLVPGDALPKFKLSNEDHHPAGGSAGPAVRSGRRVGHPALHLLVPGPPPARGFDVAWWVGNVHGWPIFILSRAYTHREYKGRITFLGSPDHNHTASIRLDRLRMSDSGRYYCWVMILSEGDAEWQSDQGTDLSVQAPTERPSATVTVTVTVTVAVEGTTPREAHLGVLCGQGRWAAAAAAGSWGGHLDLPEEEEKEEERLPGCGVVRAQGRPGDQRRQGEEAGGRGAARGRPAGAPPRRGALSTRHPSTVGWVGGKMETASRLETPLTPLPAGGGIDRWCNGSFYTISKPHFDSHYFSDKTNLPNFFSSLIGFIKVAQIIEQFISFRILSTVSSSNNI